MSYPKDGLRVKGLDAWRRELSAHFAPRGTHYDYERAKGYLRRWNELRAYRGEPVPEYGAAIRAIAEHLQI